MVKRINPNFQIKGQRNPKARAPNTESQPLMIETRDGEEPLFDETIRELPNPVEEIEGEVNQDEEIIENNEDDEKRPIIRLEDRGMTGVNLINF